MIKIKDWVGSLSQRIQLIFFYNKIFESVLMQPFLIILVRVLSFNIRKHI